MQDKLVIELKTLIEKLGAIKTKNRAARNAKRKLEAGLAFLQNEWPKEMPIIDNLQR
jgi:hypothetical protein